MEAEAGVSVTRGHKHTAENVVGRQESGTPREAVKNVEMQTRRKIRNKSQRRRECQGSVQASSRGKGHMRKARMKDRGKNVLLFTPGGSHSHP